MSNQHYFDVPFAFSGDVTAIPDPLQTGGTVSFTEGWNYNYQRNLSTDPAALPIDRSTMNWLFLQITNALQALQKETIPEFITAAQNGGTAIAYNPQAVVLWSTSGSAPFTKFVNILGTTNSNTPSASDVLGTTTGWQVACDPIATAAQATAGTNNASIMTPLLVAQQTALRALLAGNSSQVFNVAPATASTHAVQLQQAQAMRGTYQTVTTLNATATLTTAQAAGALVVYFGTTASQTLTLPTRASLVALAAFTEVNFVNTSSVPVTIAAAAGDNFGGSTTSIVLQPGDDVELVTSGTALQWIASGGSALRQFSPLIVGAATGTTQAAQLQQVQALGGGYGGITVINSTTTLTSGVAGQLLILSSAAAPTLPTAASMSVGQSITFTNQDSVAHTILANGTDTLVTAGTSVSSVTLAPGADLVLTCRSSTSWTMSRGSGKFQFNPVVVAAATASTHAMQFGQATGRLLRVTRYQLISGVLNVSVDGGAYTTTGASTFTSAANVSRTFVRIQGAGSGAPGCPSTGSNVAAAPGGTGGSYAEVMFMGASPFSAAPVTVGAGGAGGAAGLTSSTAGGASTLGSGSLICSAPGGPSISATPVGGAPLVAGGAVQASAPTTTGGFFVKTVRGGGGGYGIVASQGSNGVGGQGGTAGDGGVGPTGSTNAAGAAATNFGAGGAGATQSVASSGALAGGGGLDGYIEVFEYA